MKFYNLTMDEGEPVKLTLNNGALFRLSKENHELWERYNELRRKEDMDELEIGEFLYIAYRCAATYFEGEPMGLQEFLESMTDSRQEQANLVKCMYGMQEKKEPFPNRSARRQGKRRGR